MTQELQTTDTAKVQVSFRLTVLGNELLLKLAEHEGVSKTSFLEMTLRAAARAKGILKEDN
jgi:uncharacterized protein (DUF1778 family)